MYKRTVEQLSHRPTYIASTLLDECWVTSSSRIGLGVGKRGSKIKDRQKIITHGIPRVNHGTDSVVRRPLQSTYISHTVGSAVPRVFFSFLFYVYMHTEVAKHTTVYVLTPFLTLGSRIVIISSSDHGGKTDC